MGRSIDKSASTPGEPSATACRFEMVALANLQRHRQQVNQVLKLAADQNVEEALPDLAQERRARLNRSQHVA